MGTGLVCFRRLLTEADNEPDHRRSTIGVGPERRSRSTTGGQKMNSNSQILTFNTAPVVFR
jgi:hypothetical protein